MGPDPLIVVRSVKPSGEREMRFAEQTRGSERFATRIDPGSAALTVPVTAQRPSAVGRVLRGSALHECGGCR